MGSESNKDGMAPPVTEGIEVGDSGAAETGFKESKQTGDAGCVLVGDGAVVLGAEPSSPLAGASEQEIASAAAKAATAQAAGINNHAAQEDFDDWEDEEFGWAVGSDLEFVDEEQDSWDGPVGDGLDEEMGQNRSGKSEDGEPGRGGSSA